jgi:sulfite exporter TauE/SafE
VTALLAAILVSSLAGSLHCVAMCGPLIGLSGGSRTRRLVLVHAVVHAFGRLTTYAVLGALAGLVGGAVDLAGRLATAQHVASLVAGGVIVFGGVGSIAVALGWIRGWSAEATLWNRGLSQLRGRRAVSRAWLIGVLTGLLPCGWLWAFVVSAAGTASAGAGAAVMAVFWLGTVPAMTGVLAFGGPVIARLRRRLPVISACVLIALGLATLAVRWGDAGAPGVTSPSCHQVAS